MSEIEKLYKKAQVDGEQCCTRKDFCDNYKNPTYDHYPFHYCSQCIDYKFIYPPFTAEKQIELIKLLMKQEDFSWTIAQQGKDTKYVFYVGYEYGSGDFKEFTEALAGIINDLWAMQSLTDTEREEIRKILKG